MARLIEADTRLDAWMNAAKYLLESGPALNLTLAIESPTTGGSNDAIDKFLVEEDQFPMHTVAETIFPGVEYRLRGLPGVLEFYPEKVYPAIKKHSSIRWGTYAYRLVRRRTSDDGHINPLQQMIQKMRSELTKPAPKRSCYEIGVAEGEYDVPLHSPAEDGTRRMGGPCLSLSCPSSCSTAWSIWRPSTGATIIGTRFPATCSVLQGCRTVSRARWAGSRAVW